VVLGDAAEQLTKFSRMLNYPVTNTLMGLGAYPSTDSQFIGMLGMHGTYEANMGMHDCDVLIAIGARFDDRVTGELESFCPHAKIVHVDIDPASISKTVKVDVPIVGNVGQVLNEMIKLIESTDKRADGADLDDWWAQIRGWQSKECLAYDSSDEMWVAQYYPFDKPRRWINSGGLGTMGFGLPAALGVQLAFPDETVVCVTGEASVQMCIQELSTCLQYGTPIKIICLNNRYMGMVRQWQEFSYEKRYSHSYMDALPDFVKLTESYGHVGMRIDKPADVESSLAEAFAMKDRLVFLDFRTDQTENVYPMIEAGKGHHEMRLKPSRELA